MNSSLDGHSLQLTDGARYLDAVQAVYPENPRSVLGVRVGGRTLPLTAPVKPDEPATSLTTATEEGRRIYERSLRFVLLIALREIYPGARVRIENSTYLGVNLYVDGVHLSAQAAKNIEKRMKELIADDLPYERLPISRAEAMEYFTKDGQLDKVRLLTYRPYEHFQLYRAGGMCEYFYGEMAPSTGYTPVFRLLFRMPGLELMLPDPEDPTRPAPFRDQPKLARTFAETAEWATILGCENAADLNQMVHMRKLREFIRVNEALHERSINQIADQFVKSGAQLILIAGPSSSGKTTFAHRLTIQLKVRGLRPMKVSLDDYYIDRDQIPLDEDGRRDFEKIETLDIKLFNRNLVALMQGDEIEAPLFDFVAGKRSENTNPMRLQSGQPVVIEGIHALNDRLTEDVPRGKKFLIYVSALTTLNLDDHNRIRTTDVRLLRRMVRDRQFRGTPPEDTLAMWDSVRRGERNYIFPYMERADVMFNSTLQYELAILKKYAYPLLIDMKPESPYYTRVHRLMKFLNYIQAADVEDEIPLNSILREFIGGCCFYREED